MRIKDELYFAPGIRFAKLDSSGDNLPDQFSKRIVGYYLEPAIQLAKSDHAFASGVLLVTCIDALARYSTGKENVGDRIKEWCQQELPSFNDENTSERFYCDFRNGLVHEARIKNGGEFTLQSNRAVQTKGPILCINPSYLYEEVSQALNRFIELLKADDDKRKKLAEKITSEFKFELTK